MNYRSPVPTVSEKLASATVKLIFNAKSGTIDELEASTIFSSIGLQYPNQYTVTADEDIGSVKLKYPIVAKLVSQDLVHKTEMGAIRTDIKNIFELNDAIQEMQENVTRNYPNIQVDRVTIQEMETGVGEALIGFKRDALVGPIVTVAAGGIFTEVYNDYSVHPAPVSIETAQQMIKNVRGFEPLRGFRGMPKGDLDALAECISLVSKLALCANISEAEINPIIIKRKGFGAKCVDALIRKF
tara:strand:- start:144 stop:869 length:726 start_codon:yes stop_codon:yes gene_type:complete